MDIFRMVVGYVMRKCFHLISSEAAGDLQIHALRI